MFCPIKPGCGGGELLREGKDKDGNIKYSSATGAKGYRWLESEMVKELDKFKDIDRSYYDTLVDKAVETISKYGDFEWFVSDDPAENSPYVGNPQAYIEAVMTPSATLPCGKKHGDCRTCDQFNNDAFHLDCNKGYDIPDELLSQYCKPF